VKTTAKLCRATPIRFLAKKEENEMILRTTATKRRFSFGIPLLFLLLTLRVAAVEFAANQWDQSRDESPRRTQLKTYGPSDTPISATEDGIGQNIEPSGTTVINASDYPGENDTERLQAALNDVPPEGATVLVPPGIWVACGLTAKSRTTILGYNGTVIMRPDNTTAPFVSFENCSHFALSNLTFDGRQIKDAVGLYVLNGSLFTVEQCTFLDIDRNAVRVLASLNGLSTDFTITRNIFMHCNNAPLIVFGIPGKRAIRNFTISDNRLEGSRSNGKIAAAFATEGLIINNTVADCEFGIGTRCISNTTIKQNMIFNFTEFGIYLGTQIGDEGSENLEIQENLVVNGKTGITRYYGSYSISDIRVEDNLFINNSVYDISADFPATYINNTITSASKLIIRDPAVTFIDLETLEEGPILPGDLDSNLKIDIRDLAQVSKLYGTSEGQPTWDPRTDIIADGKIDIKDVVFVAKNYGLTI